MFSSTKYRIKVLNALSPYAYGVRRHFVILLLLNMLLVGLGFLTPLFYKIFVDDVIIGRIFSSMWVVAAGYLGISVSNFLFGYIKILSYYKLTNTVLYGARKKILEKYFTMPFCRYETTAVGDMKVCIDVDTSQISDFAEAQTITYILALATAIISAGILLYMDYRLALFSIVAIPLTFWIDCCIGDREKNINVFYRRSRGRLSNWVQHSLASWQEVKALNTSKQELHHFSRLLHDLFLCHAKWNVFVTARWFVIPKIKNEVFMKFGLYFIGGFLIIAGEIKISSLLMFAMYYEILSSAVKTVSTANGDLRSNMPFTDRLLESLTINQDLQVGGKIIPDSSNTISLDLVTYIYPNTERKIISDLNLKIYKGERVAILGKSGSGKTTILKLITGMVAPTSGCVTFSGIPLNEIDLGEMHKRMGFVMQENILFNASIRENLMYGDMNASEDEMLEACKKAYISDFVNSLEHGLDTVIGERGVKLSGGQKQRIVLARLFLCDIDIFIFDEATSALDQYSENIVYHAINTIGKDKTVIVVSHRESSIQLCDRKVVI